MPRSAPHQSPTGRDIHLVGFGSQGRAWAENLRDSGWNVHIYLARAGGSWTRALEMGFQPLALDSLPERLIAGRENPPALVAFLCPDDLIDGIYRERLAAVPRELVLVLAHGYAVYSGGLAELSRGHGVALLAPKAIGPKLRAGYSAGLPHPLKAAFQAPASPAGARGLLEALARGMGFAEQNLIPASPETEAIGDLISEQGLLCGSLFTFLDWTMEAMENAGVPPALIREECLTELELIAGLLRERGAAATLGSISAAAQAGTVRMNRKLAASGAREAFLAQVRETLSKRFVEEFASGRWRDEARALSGRLAAREKALSSAAAPSESPSKTEQRSPI